MSEAFEIRLPQFEGPFDLLLFFIERDELNIHDIPIAKITDDFLYYIQHMNTLNMELASEFIVVAATLMRIKSKMLIPRPELNSEEDEIDLKKDLTQKLVLYKKFKSISEQLREHEAERLMVEKRGNINSNLQLASQDQGAGEELTMLDLYKLMSTYDRLMKRYSDRSTSVKHTVTQYPYTIEKQKSLIASLLEVNKKMDFRGICEQSENKVHFVYNFLAILEMLQQELLEIQVGTGYNCFWIQKKTAPLPYDSKFYQESK